MELKKGTVYSKSDIGKSALALSLTANWLRKEARVTSTIRLLFVIGNAATAHLYVVLLKGKRCYTGSSISEKFILGYERS